MLAVIPTSVIGAPLALLAMLFPALLGGMALLKTRWKAALITFSVLMTLSFLCDLANAFS